MKGVTLCSGPDTPCSNMAAACVKQPNTQPDTQADTHTQADTGTEACGHVHVQQQRGMEKAETKGMGWGWGGAELGRTGTEVAEEQAKPCRVGASCGDAIVSKVLRTSTHTEAA